MRSVLGCPLSSIRKRFLPLTLLLPAALSGVCRPLSAQDFSRFVLHVSDEPGLRVTMRVYNYAHVPKPLLEGAEEEASTIFARAGTRVEWLDCPLTHDEKAQFPSCARPFGAVDYVLNLLPESMARRAHVQDTTFGFAVLTSDNERSFFASVFWNRVEEYAQAAKSSGLSAYLLLGHAMAHEMGHLLMGTMGHSRKGLMSARWGPAELDIIARNYLEFTMPQVRQMHAEILARIERRKLLANGGGPASRTQ